MLSKVSTVLLASIACFVLAANGATRYRNQSQKSLCEKDKVYHNETGSCYYPSNSPALYTVQNAPSPCGRLQFFYAVSQEYGVCDCVTEDAVIYPMSFIRPVVKWPRSGGCYFAYDQGPCKSGEWIVSNSKTFQSECRPNPCKNLKLQEPLKDITTPPTSPVDVFWFLKNSKCYQTFTRAYCEEDEYVRFTFSLEPLCVPKFFGPSGGSLSTSAKLPCAQGHKGVGDDCTPVADFD